MITVIELIRNLVEDNLITTGRDIFEYISSKIFTLTESNIYATTIKVYKNGVLWAGTNYSYDSSTGKLTVTGSLTKGDNLEITYSYYTKYSDIELKGFIRAALSYLSIEKYKTFKAGTDDIIFPTPTMSEENLIATIAAIIIKGDIKQYRTPEFTMIFNETDSRDKRIKKIIRQFRKCYGKLDYIDYQEKYVVEEE